MRGELEIRTCPIGLRSSDLLAFDIVRNVVVPPAEWQDACKYNCEDPLDGVSSSVGR